MQLLNLMARVMGTVHRIMTVTVKEHKVGEAMVHAVRILMMDFDPITGGEIQTDLSQIWCVDTLEGVGPDAMGD